MTRELVTRKIDWREIGLLLTIAAATSFITLGVLECLFNNVRCVQVGTDGSYNRLHGFQNCAPADMTQRSQDWSRSQLEP
ncbi:MAG: hypothetical protein IGR80_13070 [Synechococcales cyanobacterium K44_A2020_017]|jgi:hypothetical protein|uniref:hypothetical protein n=1 Tax=Leptolyngbya sp. CCY15150 TaxID=2767772 RepID=UPI00194DFBDC|nr:hypothetical protein [Leptolyngbya sp. CCY15150]MBF2088116.1 hypothetical protein [Synechococcales cyanobacterium K32_A2020_035]MBF2095674.1 hypothetical protein [Synechococcales cyanobacterium K44_A2020_017]